MRLELSHYGSGYLCTAQVYDVAERIYLYATPEALDMRMVRGR